MIALAVLALATAQAPPPATPAPAPAVAVDMTGGTAQVLAAFRAAQAARGPLEGLWRVTTRDGRPLYLIAIADSAGQPDPRAADPDTPDLEGAWMDLRPAGVFTGAGYLAAAKVAGRSLELFFYERGRPVTRALVLRRSGKTWSGRLDEGGRPIAVIMTRARLLESRAPPRRR
jgi:hypothetical protein